MEATLERPGRIMKPETDEQNDSLGFSIIGKIKIGEPKLPNAPGRSIDYFRATGAHSEHFHRILGEKPNILQIVFPTDNPLQVCHQRIEGRDDEGNLAAISYGRYHLLYDDVVKDYIPVTNEVFEKAKTQGIKITRGYGAKAKEEMVRINHWKERLTMRFFVLKLKGILGVWELSTGGVESSIPNIIQNYDEIAYRAGRNINRIVFDLTVHFAISQKPGNPSKYPVLTLTPNLSFESSLVLNEFKDAGIEFNQLISDENIRSMIDGGKVQRQLPASGIPVETHNTDQLFGSEVQYISEGKAAGLWAIARQNGFDQDKLKAYLLTKNIDSLKKISVEWFDIIVEELKDGTAMRIIQ